MLSVFVAVSYIPGIDMPVYAVDSDEKINENIAPEFIPEEGPVALPTAEADGMVNAHSFVDTSVLPSSYGTEVVEAASSAAKDYDIAKVRNQNPWGCCWAFAGNTVLERRMEYGTDTATYDFSEEHMLHKLSKESNYGYIIGSKNYGGNADYALAYFVSNLGVMDEADYPFLVNKDIGNLAGYDSSANSTLRATDAIFLSPEYNNDNSMTKDSIDETKAAIMEYGSVYGYMRMDEKYYNNSTDAYCIKTPRDTVQINHAITVVGWDDDFSASNFLNGSVTTDGAWIIQNSWGPREGINGYFYISYEDTQFMPAAAITGYEYMDFHDTIYQHDEGAPLVAGIKSYSRELMYTNVYDIEHEATLSEVTIFTDAYREICKFYIMPVDDNGIPLWEDRISVSGNNVISYGGYHTFKLDELEIPEGKIAIGAAVTADNAINYMSFGREWNDPGVFTPTTHSGESFEIQTYSGKVTDVTNTTVANKTNYSIKLVVNEKHDYNSKVLQEPDCVTPGVMEYTCDCGDTYTEEIPVVAHTWDNGSVTKEATCVEAGEKLFTCTYCHQTRTEITPMTDHEYSDSFTVDTAATDSQAGSASRHCNFCDSKIDLVEIPAGNGHHWNGGEVIRDAKCGEDGIMLYTCTDAGCNDTVEADIRKSENHTYGEAVETVEATCSQNGISIETCERCGYEHQIDFGKNPDNHSYETVASVEVTCQNPGYIDERCSLCGDEKHTDIEVCDHEYDDFVVDEEPTCYSEGSKSRHCKWYEQCHSSIDITSIGKTAHNYEKTGEIVCTCKERTKVNYVCTICNQKKVETLYSYGPHNFVENIQPATFNQNGTYSKVCSVCNKYDRTTEIDGISKCSLSSTSLTYTGKTLKPTVKVYDVHDNVIPTDQYTVTYPSSSYKVGKYSVTVTFKDRYEGSKTLTYKINPPKTSLKKLYRKSKAFTAKWTKKTTSVTGYQIQYSRSSSFKSGNKTKTVSGSSKTSVTIKKLKKKKRYYVRVRTYKKVNGVTFYSSWSSKKSVVTK